MGNLGETSNTTNFSVGTPAENVRKFNSNKQTQANDGKTPGTKKAAQDGLIDLSTINPDDYKTTENQDAVQPNDAMTDEQRADYEKKARRARLWAGITDGLAGIASLGGTMAGGLPTRHVTDLDKMRKEEADVLAADKAKNDAYWQRFREAKERDRQESKARYDNAVQQADWKNKHWKYMNVDLPAQQAKAEREKQAAEDTRQTNEARRKYYQAQEEAAKAQSRVRNAQGKNLENGKPANGVQPRSGGSRGGSGSGRKGGFEVAGKIYNAQWEAEAAASEYNKAHGINNTETVQSTDAYGKQTTRNRQKKSARVIADANDHYKQSQKLGKNPVGL